MCVQSIIMPMLLLSVVEFSGTPGTGSVVLANQGDKSVRIWRTGNSWGDNALVFELHKPPIIAHVIRAPQIYTRNVPASVVVSPGDSHVWHFDFGDGSWEIDVPFDELVKPGAELTAVYEAGESPEALANDVWTGCLRSQPARWLNVKAPSN